VKQKPFYLSFLIISTGFGFSSANIVGTSLISKWFIAGPVVLGLIDDLQKSYRLGLVVLSQTNLLAFFFIMLLKRPALRREAEKGPEKLGCAP